ncbi:uncharacterized protein LOC135089218 isoform X2 [Scylla paramamosain]|uniref:uncharacterized protein LOC135089218 isoform X2 n=1 Tax=Scylla paramamosain TaxID=85552 RepID=UPI003083C5B9
MQEESSDGGAATKGQKWLRPATDKEEYFEIGHRNNYGQTFFGIELTSSRPLGEDLVKRALVHLYWKVPVLRLCLGRRDGRLWLREMDSCILDFKVVKDGVEEDEQQKLIEHIFNTAEGPMWCARFLPAAGGQGGVLLLGVHHTATDGLSNIKICHFLHTILDDLTAERRVDDAEQLADHVGDEEARLLYERERQRLLHDPDLYRRRKEELMAATKVPPPILSVLSFPRNEVATTRSVKLVLDEPATQAFRQICQAEGVSLHCALTGVVNVAMLGILEALPNTPPEHNFVCSHDINLRRYYEGDTSRILGVHIATFSYKMSLVTPKDVMHKFWPYVLELHGRLREDLKDRAPLQAVALRLMERSKDDNFKECFSSTADPEYCYAISNVGDVTSTLPGNGDFVQVTNLTWCASLRRLVSLMCFNVHTFRGKLNINLAYSTHFMGRDTAQQIVNNMHDVITSLSTKDHGGRE